MVHNTSLLEGIKELKGLKSLSFAIFKELNLRQFFKMYK